jgi:hypothetical protein
MNIVATGSAPPHFFLVGFRAPPGQLFNANNPNAERVGTVVARMCLQFDTTPVAAGDVLLQDEPYPTFPQAGPFRFESEIAPWKPEPDVVVIDRLATFLTPPQQADLNPPNAQAVAGHIELSNFGTVEVRRGAGFGVPTARPFGWRGRGAGARLAQAGRTGGANDPSSLWDFDASRFDLPDAYDNRFQNGRPLAGQAAFAPGDQLRFTDAAGPVSLLTIPAAPTLKASQDGAPLNPPLVLTPLVDTVVMDREAGTFILIWRATFRWEARLEQATLEIG